MQVNFDFSLNMIEGEAILTEHTCNRGEAVLTDHDIEGEGVLTDYYIEWESILTDHDRARGGVRPY